MHTVHVCSIVLTTLTTHAQTHIIWQKTAKIIIMLKSLVLACRNV